MLKKSLNPCLKKKSCLRRSLRHGGAAGFLARVAPVAVLFAMLLLVLGRLYMGARSELNLARETYEQVHKHKLPTRARPRREIRHYHPATTIAVSRCVATPVLLH